MDRGAVAGAARGALEKLTMRSFRQRTAQHCKALHVLLDVLRIQRFVSSRLPSQGWVSRLSIAL